MLSNYVDYQYYPAHEGNWDVSKVSEEDGFWLNNGRNSLRLYPIENKVYLVDDETLDYLELTYDTNQIQKYLSTEFPIEKMTKEEVDRFLEGKWTIEDSNEIWEEEPCFMIQEDDRAMPDSYYFKNYIKNGNDLEDESFKFKQDFAVVHYMDEGQINQGAYIIETYSSEPTMSGKRYREICKKKFWDACELNESESWYKKKDYSLLKYSKEEDTYYFKRNLPAGGEIYDTGYYIKNIEKNQNQTLLHLIQYKYKTYTTTTVFDRYYLPIKYEDVLEVNREEAFLSSILIPLSDSFDQATLVLEKQGEENKIVSVSVDEPAPIIKTADEYVSMGKSRNDYLKVKFNISGKAAYFMNREINRGEINALEVFEDENKVTLTTYMVYISYKEDYGEELSPYYVVPRTFVLDKNTLMIHEQ